MQEEILRINGLADSTGGRKANLYEYEALEKGSHRRWKLWRIILSWPLWISTGNF